MVFSSKDLEQIEHISMEFRTHDRIPIFKVDEGSLSVETSLPDSIREIPRLDETTYKYLGFEMKKGEVEGKEMMAKLEERIREKLE